MSLNELVIIVGLLAQVATISGIPIAIIIFYRERSRERREREYGTYDVFEIHKWQWMKRKKHVVEKILNG